MSDGTCDCGGVGGSDGDRQRRVERGPDPNSGDRRSAGGSPGSDGGAVPLEERWLEARPVTAATLPVDVAAALAEFYGVEDVATLGDVVDATRSLAGDDGIAVDQLCHVEPPSPHVAHTATESYHFACFYDGVALAALVEERVEVETVSPTGDEIRVVATPGGDLDTTPDDAVVSFGVSPAAARAVEAPAPEDVYEAVCGHVRAFPDRERYEYWAVGVEAPTVGVSIADSAPFALALVA